MDILSLEEHKALAKNNLERLGLNTQYAKGDYDYYQVSQLAISSLIDRIERLEEHQDLEEP